MIYRLLLWLGWAAASWMWIRLLRQRSSVGPEQAGRWLAVFGTAFVGALFGFLLGVSYPSGGDGLDFLILLFTTPVGLVTGAVIAGSISSWAWRAEHTRVATKFFAPFIGAAALLVSMECVVKCGRLFCSGYEFFTPRCM